MRIQKAKSQVIMVMSKDKPACPRMILGNKTKYARIRDDYYGEIAIGKNIIGKLSLL